jgi:hypothetical protein
MNDQSRFDLRVAELIDAYADRAPVDVDAIAMARFIAAGQRVRGPIALLVVPSRLRLGLVVAVIALVGALVGGAIVAGGRLFERDRDPMLPEGGLVGPFIGLPPAGATPSRPAIGNLVLEASGRCTGDGAFCFVWLYADGRLIWLRDGALPFGANEGSTGLLEQRLAPSGVERLVSAFMATGACSGADRDEPIVCNAPMPGPAPFPAIPDPGWVDRSWGLAPSSWEDPAIWGFVPSTVGACFESNTVSASSDASWQRVEPSRVLGLLPPGAADRLRGRDIEFPALMEGWPGLQMTCFGVTTDEARAVSDILSRAGLERDEYMAAYLLGYHLGAPPPYQDAAIWFGPILPHGSWFVSGGG